MPSSFRPKLLLYRGTGFIPAMIRWQTDGDVAHAALWVRDNQVIEAREFVGVRARSADDIDQADVFDIKDFTDAQWAQAVAFAREQIGKGYDYWAIVCFITRLRSLRVEKDADAKRWFCSELVFGSILAGGLALLRDVPAIAVSPERLNTSPLLLPISSGVPKKAPRLFGERRAAAWRHLQLRRQQVRQPIFPRIEST